VPLQLTRRRAREVPVDPRGRAGGGTGRSFPSPLPLLLIDRSTCHRGLRVSCFRLAYGWPIELEAVGVVDDAVENGIGECWLADDLVPLVDRQL
jgi:hypothetical protein